jgi:phenylacetate-CoA ligase
MFAGLESGRTGVPRLSVSAPIEEMVDALNRYQPEAILAYASVAATLADEQLEGRLVIAPRVVI